MASQPNVELLVRKEETLNKALKRFRKMCEKAGLRKEMKRKMYYEKESQRRRREVIKRKRALLKKQRMEAKKKKKRR
ncbi:MAG: 30S ribosomal protein S21 [Planctomycetota bacterium]|nr:MAG: 30S ribosomal protein S21 [Planctomycetota bacterium]